MPPPEKIPQEKVEAILELVHDFIRICEQMDKILEIVQTKPRTEWDEKVYQIYEPDHSPFTGVGQQIDFHHFQLIWKQIEELLTKEELEALRQWGIKVDDGWGWPESILFKLPSLRMIKY